MRREKQLLLNEIQEKIDSASAMIVTSYNQLPPNLSWNLRDQLAKADSHFEVMRKRVFLKAAEKSGLKFDESALKGHVGVVFIKGEDAAAPAKVVMKFSEANSNILEMLCGQIEGKMMPGSDIQTLSKLPGINEMKAELIGLFIAPMAQLLSVFEAMIERPLAEQKS